MFLLRKITRGKWAKALENPLIKNFDIDADTVIYEFKTEGNKLSVWLVNNDDDLNDAFIALASNMDSLGTIDAVKLAEEDLQSLSLDPELGGTPTFEINHKHRNITELTYGKIGIVIEAILRGIMNKCIERRTKGKLKELLINAYKAGKLDIEKMSPRILKDIGINSGNISN